MNDPVLPGAPNDAGDIPDCPTCGKPRPLCQCDDAAPVTCSTRLVILQHPQEQDRLLGTARLTAACISGAMVKVGLSWPSLSKLLGQTVDPARWAVLYLGSARIAPGAAGGEVVAVDRQGEPERDQAGILDEIEGVILLDGTWSQAKALWWRNPWLLKCQRIVLTPSQPSLYGKLRREPRREGISTLEAAGLVISHIEGRDDVKETLERAFQTLLTRYRGLATSHPELVPPARPKRDWRRRKGSPAAR